MTFSTLLQILKSRIWLLILLPLAAAGTAMYITSNKPTNYSASSTILINYRQQLEGGLAGELLPVGLQQSYLSTQMDIIASRPVADIVIGLLNPDVIETLQNRYDRDKQDIGDVSFDSWTIAWVMDNLKVVAGSESRLVEIWFQDVNPEIAAATANAFVDGYRQFNKQLGRNPALETADSVETMLVELRANLEEAENKVSTYQGQKGIIASEERLDVETKHLNELMQQKLASETNLRATQIRFNSVQELLSQGKSTDSIAAIVGSDVIQNLQLKVARKTGEIAELSTSLGERHPDMRKHRAELRSLRNDLNAEKNSILTGITNELEETKQLTEADRLAAETQKQKVLELKLVRDGLQPLLRELESAKDGYDRALEMFSEYELQSNLNQSSVSVVQEARVPEKPGAPNLIVNVASALIAGLIFAIGLALFWELFDRKVRGKDDFENLGDIEYMGELPKAG